METPSHTAQASSPTSAQPPAVDGSEYSADATEPGPETFRAPEFSEEALALEFSRRHGQDLQYVPPWNQWYKFRGSHWCEDTTLQVYDRMRAVVREAANACPNPKTAVVIASAKSVAGGERLTRSDPRHVATVAQWDADPFLLATPGGTVDLKTGELRRARREDFITRCTAVTPDGDCELFDKVLARICNDDHELVGYLRRLCGYYLTGVTTEHEMYFAYGGGRNGKGVFYGTIRGIMNDYAATAPSETFMASHGERHPTDLAGFRGKRLVLATETERGSRWAEAKIKALTGGDAIAARFMRQDFFEYLPQFKIVITGNHRPTIRSLDEAMRSRVKLLPFTVTIPRAERDKRLQEKLKAEWPGILAWMIRGCLEWQQHGLRPPASVLEATESYFADEDALAKWIGESCDTDPNAFATSADLYSNWRKWADASGEFIGSIKMFTQQLEARGFERHREPGTGRAGFIGIEPRCLKPSDPPPG